MNLERTNNTSVYCLQSLCRPMCFLADDKVAIISHSFTRLSVSDCVSDCECDVTFVSVTD